MLSLTMSHFFAKGLKIVYTACHESLVSATNIIRQDSQTKLLGKELDEKVLRQRKPHHGVQMRYISERTRNWEKNHPY